MLAAAGGTTADPDLGGDVAQVPALADRVARCETHPVPRLSEFYGIVISLYWAEHPPPHFTPGTASTGPSTSKRWRCLPVVFPAGRCALSGGGASCTERSSFPVGASRAGPGRICCGRTVATESPPILQRRVPNCCWCRGYLSIMGRQRPHGSIASPSSRKPPLSPTGTGGLPVTPWRRIQSPSGTSDRGRTVWGVCSGTPRGCGPGRFATCPGAAPRGCSGRLSLARSGARVLTHRERDRPHDEPFFEPGAVVEC